MRLTRDEISEIRQDAELGLGGDARCAARTRSPRCRHTASTTRLGQKAFFAAADVLARRSQRLVRRRADPGCSRSAIAADVRERRQRRGRRAGRPRRRSFRRASGNSSTASVSRGVVHRQRRLAERPAAAADAGISALTTSLRATWPEPLLLLAISKNRRGLLRGLLRRGVLALRRRRARSSCA